MKPLAFLFALLLTSAATADEPATAVTWGAVKTPGDGQPQSIGGYSAGCLDGASRLPLRGAGWFVTRPERGRFYGHPDLIAVIREVGKRLVTLHLPALPIGDLSQPRGGPAPSGHASHQTGLDVDVAYVAPGPDGKAVSLVDLDRRHLTGRLSAAVARMLALVAGDARVDRVFVNPVIKRALCEQARTDRGWLHKIRPWWGHHDHFHVRLACPAGSAQCEPSAAIPDGDGCDQLAWWFRGKSDDERETARKKYQDKVGTTPTLPAACAALVAR